MYLLFDILHSLLQLCSILHISKIIQYFSDSLHLMRYPLIPSFNKRHVFIILYSHVLFYCLFMPSNFNIQSCCCICRKILLLYIFCCFIFVLFGNHTWKCSTFRSHSWRYLGDYIRCWRSKFGGTHSRKLSICYIPAP